MGLESKCNQQHFPNKDLDNEHVQNKPVETKLTAADGLPVNVPLFTLKMDLLSRTKPRPLNDETTLLKRS